MNKIIGYFLVCVGLALMFFATISMFKVFVDKQPPAQLVSAGKMAVSTQYGPMDVEMSMLSNVLNLVLHGFLMFFIAGIGGRLINGGANLVKADTFAAALKNASLQDIKKL